MLLAAQILHASSPRPNEQITWGKKINLQIKDMLLPDALTLLLKDTGVAIDVKPEVANLKVTADFKDVSLKTALGELERVSNTTMILSIGRGGTLPAPLVLSKWAIDPNSTLTVMKHTDTPIKIEKKEVELPKDASIIPLHDTSRQDMIRMLGIVDWVDFFRGRASEFTEMSWPMMDSIPRGITSISVPRDVDGLLVTGDKDAVEELARIVSELAAEPQKTQRINVRITRYSLGSEVPESVKLEDCWGSTGGSKGGGVTKAQLDALTAELRGKDIEPTAFADIATIDSLPVSLRVYGGGLAYVREATDSYIPVQSLEFQVTPRLNYKDKSITMDIVMVYTFGPLDTGLGLTTTLMGGTLRVAQGESYVYFESQPAFCELGGMLTIITPSL